MNWEEAKEGFEGYLKLEKSLSQNSVSAYINDINKLITYLEQKFGGMLPAAVRLAHLKDFVKWLNEEGVSPRTQARTISGIKSFYKYLLLEEVTDIDPTSLLEAPKVGRKLPDILSADEIDMLINAVDIYRSEGQRNKAILEILYGCGLRVSELVSLRISDLHFEKGYIRVLGKSDRERLVPISRRAIDEVESYRNGYRTSLKVAEEDADILFLNRRGRKLSRVMIFTIIKNLADKVKLNKKISPHTFRHSFATHLIDGGADLRVVQEMLGHESILTTEIYTHLDRNYLQDTINQFHPRK
ncbi:site-specific tyrosine recombinase XerD [Prolixibacteraceae bacterium JC049]|nr:site-specific tyrosine recombinase XerD [Prolixibacteraceae bacterium JC049]